MLTQIRMALPLSFDMAKASSQLRSNRTKTGFCQSRAVGAYHMRSRAVPCGPGPGGEVVWAWSSWEPQSSRDSHRASPVGEAALCEMLQRIADAVEKWERVFMRTRTPISLLMLKPKEGMCQPGSGNMVPKLQVPRLGARARIRSYCCANPKKSNRSSSNAHGDRDVPVGPSDDRLLSPACHSHTATWC